MGIILIRNYNVYMCNLAQSDSFLIWSFATVHQIKALIPFTLAQSALIYINRDTSVNVAKPILSSSGFCVCIVKVYNSFLRGVGKSLLEVRSLAKFSDHVCYLVKLQHITLQGYGHGQSNKEWGLNSF